MSVILSISDSLKWDFGEMRHFKSIANAKNILHISMQFIVNFN